MIDLLIVTICSAAIALLGLLVLLRNPSQSGNRYFAILSLALMAWTVCNYYSEFASQNNLLFTRLTFFFGVAVVSAVMWFMLNFPSTLSLRKFKLPLLHQALSLLLLPLALSGYIIDSVTATSIIVGPLYNLFIVYVAFSLALVILVLRKQKQDVSGSLQRMQLAVVSLAVILYAILAVVANVLIPLITESWTASRYGPVFTLVLVGIMTYGIIRHKLFDIRLVIARSIAYTLLLGTLGLIYGMAIFGISTYFFPGELVSTGQQLVYVGLAIILAYTFQPLRSFFEKVTDKVFYRDRYDSQQVLGKLGEIFSTQIDINVITHATVGVLAETLKPTHARLLVIDGRRVYRSAVLGPAPNHINSLQVRHLHKSLYVADELDGGVVKKFMGEQDMAVAVKLATQEGTVGFLFLGPKQSGAIYNTQDVQLFETAGPALAVALQNARSFEKIADFNVTLQKRIDEATLRLKDQNQKLRELDEAKDEFISMASHQLRTPLTAIKGYLSMLLEGDAGKLDHKQHEFADLSFMSAQRMVYLIADMLNVSRINTGKLVIEPAPFDLEKVIKEEIKQLERTAASRNVILGFVPPKPKLPPVNLDEGKMRQVIMNFIDNAVYYAPNSTIEIGLEKVSDKLRFTVKDHGIGVPEKEKRNLFVKFYRAENAKKARPDGTGLGLYMAKMVVELQGGSIIFVSELGKGSTFGFEFPLSVLARSARPAATKPVATVLSQ
ncbi:hypothetical protein HY346_01630 [Candidatus Microgenomates bacterium]|nr:hypothetical protein [Candidatus Microgenomates bacterium]